MTTTDFVARTQSTGGGCSRDDSLTRRITEILRKHESGGDSIHWWCVCGTSRQQSPHRTHVAHVGALIAEAAEEHYRRRIDTVEQLDALPEHVVVLDANHSVWERNTGWSPGEPWWCTASEIEQPSSMIELPAVLVWSPEADQPDDDVVDAEITCSAEHPVVANHHCGRPEHHPGPHATTVLLWPTETVRR